MIGASLMMNVKERLAVVVSWMRKTDARRIAIFMRRFVQEHTVAVTIAGAALIIVCGCRILIPPQGRIIAIDREIRQALDLLQSTPTGKKIVQKARLSTKGAPVFLVFGTTEGCNIKDKSGDPVNGLTRVSFQSFYQTYTTNGILVYTNKDMARSDIRFMALVLAFELENVIYAMKFPSIEPGKDSPEAENSLYQVAMEFKK